MDIEVLPPFMAYKFLEVESDTNQKSNGYGIAIRIERSRVKHLGDVMGIYGRNIQDFETKEKASFNKFNHGEVCVNPQVCIGPTYNYLPLPQIQPYS
jgi:hypothetical protein